MNFSLLDYHISKIDDLEEEHSRIVFITFFSFFLFQYYLQHNKILYQNISLQFYWLPNASQVHNPHSSMLLTILQNFIPLHFNSNLLTSKFFSCSHASAMAIKKRNMTRHHKPYPTRVPQTLHGHGSTICTTRPQAKPQCIDLSVATREQMP